MTDLDELKPALMDALEGSSAPWVIESVRDLLLRLEKAESERDHFKGRHEWASGACEMSVQAIVKMNARISELEAALRLIRRGPVKPLPDPGAHSWRAFAEAVFAAMRDNQRIANRALGERDE